MGANKTQAQGVVLFLVAFVLIAAGLAADYSVIMLLAGLAALGAAMALFARCKPWEHSEE
jgi:VIT1/CCC1 family predicted Fe2+/Mn2+ transporter